MYTEAELDFIYSRNVDVNPAVGAPAPSYVIKRNKTIIPIINLTQLLFLPFYFIGTAWMMSTEYRDSTTLKAG